MSDRCKELHPEYHTRCYEIHEDGLTVRHDDGVVDWRTPSALDDAIKTLWRIKDRWDIGMAVAFFERNPQFVVKEDIQVDNS